MPDVNPAPPGASTRRERLHDATRGELVAAARELLVGGGVERVTVREVAAAVGMTAPGMYRYFGSREALLEGLIDVLYEELADDLFAARESRRSGSLTSRFMVTCRAFRTWAFEHRAEFGLLFGAPVPGVEQSHKTPEDIRGKRFGQVWMELFLEIDAAGLSIPTPSAPATPALVEQLDEFIRRADLPLDIESARAFLTGWQGLYGFVCIEVFGHLDWALTDTTSLWEDRLEEHRVRLGLPAES